MLAGSMVGIFGIVNITRDSFSDGGRWLEPAAAIAHAERLLAAGADVLDLGAESTHPDAEFVAADDELRRLVPVVDALLARAATVSIDSRQPPVMAALLARGVHWWNDIAGFQSPAAMAVAAAAPPHVRFVAMFQRGGAGKAARAELGAEGVVEAFAAFAAERIAAFAAAGIARERLVLDPGMGFFLARAAAPSLRVLHHLGALQQRWGPLLVSVSRKSFVGEVTGQPLGERGPGSLAAELAAVRAGVAFVRTHDVAALRAGVAMQAAIDAAR